MRALVVNAGSSSVKLRVIGDGDVVEATCDLGPPGPDFAEQLLDFATGAGPLDVVGHRIVHGGSVFVRSVVVDDSVAADLDSLGALAPLHNPPALAALAAIRRLRPGLPSVACFDTAFHASMPPEATTYGLPAAWVQRWNLRRFGFHGLSCAWATARVPEVLGWASGASRMVICHLGAGASVTAVADGQSVDTTMGFSPLEGLVMATRPGDVDPGILTWLMRQDIAPDELDDALERRSGLAAISGEPTGDMRKLLVRRAAGDAAAGLAVSVFLHRLRGKVAAMTAALGGLDALVFTGGIGEHGATIRDEACACLSWLGVAIDHHANLAAIGRDADISTPTAPARTVVVCAREDLVIAAECRSLLA